MRVLTKINAGSVIAKVSRCVYMTILASDSDNIEW